MNIDKKKIKSLCVIALMVCCGIFLLIGIVQIKNVKADTGIWSEVEYQEEYSFNEALALQKRTLTIGGQTYDSYVTLTYPDGTATRASTVLLQQSGKYIVKYTANVDSIPYYDFFEFTVKYKTVSYGADSSVAYGKAENAKTKSGLLVRLAEGDELTFNHIIDVNDLAASDVLVEFFATPNTSGVMDFGLLYFQLTDVEDDDNYIVFSATQSFESADTPHTYVKAGGNGQILEGWEHGREALHRGGEGGTPVFHNFGSCNYGYKPVANDSWTVSLFYDADNKIIYVNEFFVIDLDSPDYYSTLWQGFKSGKVRLSVYADDYRGAGTANFCLSNVFGLTLQEDTVNETIIDEREPLITVDTSYEELPVAKVGQRYLIPGATAMDTYSGDRKVSVKVWYNYFSQNAVLVEMDANHRITPKYAGVYTVVYEAKDAIGNIAKKIQLFRAKMEIEELTIEIGAVQTTALLGEKVEVPQAILSGGSGNTEYKIFVKYGSTEEEIIDGFIPEKAGEYTVEYRATDYIESVATYSYTVDAQANPTLLFVDKPTYPKVFISGSAYTLPVYYINDYSTGTLVQHETDIFVKDKDGQRKILSGESFVPMVTNSGDTVSLIYAYGDYVSETIEIPTIIPFYEVSSRPRLQMENYLCGDDMTFTKSMDGITITASTEGDIGWTFANSLLVKNFYISIGAADSVEKFESLEITLTDAEDEKISVKAVLENHGSYVTIVVGKERVISSFGFGKNATEKELMLSFTDNAFVVGSFKAYVDTTVTGEKFEGFKSKKIWLSVTMNDATAGASYTVINIDGQPMSNITTDRVAPNLAYYGDHGGSYAKDSIVSIPPVIYASDVLDPNTNFKMTVEKDGVIVSDINGKLLDGVDPYIEYQIKLSEYGQYIVKYIALDTFNARSNESSYSYSLNVEDVERPMLTINGTMPTSVKVGTSINIPNISASDNLTSNENIVITKYVYLPSGRLFYLTDNSVKLTEIGVYEFQFYAYDEAGNLAMHTVKVEVVE